MVGVVFLRARGAPLCPPNWCARCADCLVCKLLDSIRGTCRAVLSEEDQGVQPSSAGCMNPLCLVLVLQLPSSSSPCLAWTHLGPPLPTFLFPHGASSANNLLSLLELCRANLGTGVTTCTSMYVLATSTITVPCTEGMSTGPEDNLDWGADKLGGTGKNDS